MIICIFLIGMLCLPGLKIRIKGFQEGYISSSKTMSIKGIFLLLVFISHFYSYVTLSPGILNDSYIWVRRFLGQMIVAPFLFYSGYGIAQSLSKKPAYLKRMLVHRILKVLFQFDLAVLLFLVYRTITGTYYSIQKILLTLIGWDGIGNSNWYVFAILWMYIFTWIAYSVFENDEKLGLYACTALVLVFIYIMSLYRESYWYNTVMCYVAGLWFSQYQDQIEKKLFSQERIFWFVFAMTGILFVIFHQNWWKSLVVYQTTSVLFALLIVFFSVKVCVGNCILDYCGKHLFSLYILQRIPMMVLKDAFAENHAAYFILSLVLTIGMAHVFDLTMPKIWNAICKKSGEIRLRNKRKEA